jgi:hypothetical protein
MERRETQLEIVLTIQDDEMRQSLRVGVPV